MRLETIPEMCSKCGDPMRGKLAVGVVEVEAGVGVAVCWRERG